MLSFLMKKKVVEFKAPVIGTAIDITQVPDEVFAQKIVGDGLAFEPADGVLYSPVDGEVIQVFPTKHAIGIRTPEGLEVLIHIGIDTVNMKGEGFESFIAANQTIHVGDKMMTFDRDLIRKKAKSTMIPLLITNMDRVRSIACEYGKVETSNAVMRVRMK